jgi:hypothetical protein
MATFESICLGSAITGFLVLFGRHPDVVGRPQLAAPLQEKVAGVGRNLMGQTSVLKRFGHRFR